MYIYIYVCMYKPSTSIRPIVKVLLPPESLDEGAGQRAARIAARSALADLTCKASRILRPTQ